MTPVVWIFLALGIVAGGATGFTVGKQRGRVEAEADIQASAKAASDAAIGVAKALENNTAAMADLTAAAQKPIVLDA